MQNVEAKTKTQLKRFAAHMHGWNIDNITRWSIVVIGICVVIGGVYQIRSTLFIQERIADQHVAQLKQDADTYGSTSFTADTDAAALVEQTQADPDEDSLSTFDELNIYGTSPYLADSDSDGIADNDEIAQNTDPNCPEGDDCAVVRTGGDGTTTAAEQEFTEFTPSNNPATAEVAPDALRQELVNLGVAPETLEGISDEELVTLYNQSTNTESATASQANIDDVINQYRNLSTADKRVLLVESGVEQTEVDKLSDAEVDAILEDSINQAVNDLEAGNSPTTDATGN